MAEHIFEQQLEGLKQLEEKNMKRHEELIGFMGDVAEILQAQKGDIEDLKEEMYTQGQVVEGVLQGLETMRWELQEVKKMQVAPAPAEEPEDSRVNMLKNKIVKKWKSKTAESTPAPNVKMGSSRIKPLMAAGKKGGAKGGGKGGKMFDRLPSNSPSIRDSAMFRKGGSNIVSSPHRGTSFSTKRPVFSPDPSFLLFTLCTNPKDKTRKI